MPPVALKVGARSVAAGGDVDVDAERTFHNLLASFHTPLTPVQDLLREWSTLQQALKSSHAAESSLCPFPSAR